MNRTDFSKLGLQYGLDESWTLAALDSLSYAECLNDLLKNLNLKSQVQLNDIMMFGGSSVWEAQDALYNYLFNEKHIYRDWSPKVTTGVLSSEDFSELKKYVQMVMEKRGFLEWCDIFNRYALYDSVYLQTIHKTLTPMMERIVNKKLSPSYSYLSLYGGEGICPAHRDQDKCQWTLDLCVAQNQTWDIFVENKPFTLKENDALVYSGTDQFHWREKIQPNSFCHLVFFHFIESE